jgi:hypothetical protein
MHHFSRYKRRDDAIAQQLVKEHMHQLDAGETWVGHGGTWGSRKVGSSPRKIVPVSFFHGLWGNKTWG